MGKESSAEEAARQLDESMAEIKNSKGMSRRETDITDDYGDSSESSVGFDGLEEITEGQESSFDDDSIFDFEDDDDVGGGETEQEEEPEDTGEETEEEEEPEPVREKKERDIDAEAAEWEREQEEKRRKREAKEAERKKREEERKKKEREFGLSEGEDEEPEEKPVKKKADSSAKKSSSGTKPKGSRSSTGSRKSKDSTSSTSSESRGTGNKKPVIFGILAGVVLTVLIVVVGLGSNGKLGGGSGDAENIARTDYKLAEDKTGMIDEIQASIDNLYNRNAYMILHVGAEEDDVIYLCYNKDRECYAESAQNNVALVYRKDHKAVVLTDPIELAYDLDCLSYTESALNLVKTGFASIETSDTGVDDVKGYKIDITGKHNIRKLYTQYSREFADKIMGDIFGADYDADKYKDDDYKDKNDTDCITLTVNIGDGGQFGIDCSILIGDQEYTSWWFDGYLDMDPFTLNEDWYVDSLEDADVEEWKEKATDIQNQLKENIKSYQQKAEAEADEYAGYTDEQVRDMKESKEAEEKANEEAAAEVSDEDGLTDAVRDALSAEEKEEAKAVWEIDKRIQAGEKVTDKEKERLYAFNAKINALINSGNEDPENK